MTLDTAWADIVETSEYVNDLAKLTTITVNALGIEEYVDGSSPFVFALANLLAIQRYFIRHQPELVDIDVTPFIDLIRKEVGFDLPISDDLPILEWLREAKSWYGHRGSLNMYPFIGALVNSPIEIDYPAQLIARFDMQNTYLDGRITSHGGKVPFNTSKLGRIRDGVKWSQFVYFIEVLQAQDVLNITDLENLLKNVHPAGTQKFITYDFNESVTVPEEVLLGYAGDFIFGSSLALAWPTLDNNLISDLPSCQWDQHFQALIVGIEIDDVAPGTDGYCYRQVPYDSLTNIYVGVRTYAGVQRQKWNAATEAYDQYFSDNDALVYENVTTNMGLATYTYAETNALTYRQMKDIAWNNDQKNMQSQNWMPDLLNLDVIIT